MFQVIDAAKTKITEVAAGTIADGSTDAVNGSQLYSAESSLSSVASALGGGAVYDSTAGTFSAPSYTVNSDSGTVTVHDVGTALTDINSYVNEGITFSANSGTAYKATPNSTISVVGQGLAVTPVDKGPTYVGTNLYTNESGGMIDILMSTTPSFTSMTTGNTVMNTSGITTGTISINGATSTGANTITGLSNTTWNFAAITTGRAATEDQLEIAEAAATTKVTGGTNTHVTSAANTDGSTTYQVNLDTNSTLGTGTDAVNLNGNAGTITVGDVKTTDAVSINGVTGVVKTGTINITGGSTNTITGLNNTTWNSSNYISSRAATEGELSGLSSTLTGEGLKFAGNSGNSTVELGSTVNVLGQGTAITPETNGTTYIGTNLYTSEGNGTIDILMSETPSFTSVMTSDTNGMATLDGSTLTETNITTDSGSSTETTKEAIVSPSALTASKSITSSGTTTTNTTAVSSNGITISQTVGSNSSINGPSMTMSGIDAANTKITNVLAGNGTTGTITAETKVSLNGTTGNAAIGNVTINGSGSTGTITGLTNKAWNPESITSGQAATEDQLKTLDSRSVQYAQNSDGTTNTSAIKLSGTNGTTISNVAAGEVSATSTDAVNGGQLYSVNQSVAEEGSAINTLGHDLSNLSTRVNKVGAGAAALAGLHPLDFNPDDKLDVAAGYGTYKSQNAMSLGVFYHANANTMFSMAASMGNGENMVSAGLTFKIGSGGTGNYNHFLSNGNVTVLQKEIQTLQNQNQVLISDNVQMKKDSEQMKQDNEQIKKDNEEMKKDNEQMKAEIELLKQKMGL